MTQVDEVVGAAAAGPHHRSALSRIVTRPDDLGAVWGREPLLSRSADLPRSFDDLFGQESVDVLVSTHGLRTPFLRVARAGATLHEREFTAGGGVGAAIGDQVSDDKLVRLFAEGSTLVLQGLHRTHAPMVRFSQQLAAELGHPVQVNAYVTPPQNQGFSDHYDVHDVFVLQVHGRKRWIVHAPVVHPSPGPAVDRPPREVEAAAATAPGSTRSSSPATGCTCRGATSTPPPRWARSTHLTIGVHPWTRHDVVRLLLAARRRRPGAPCVAAHGHRRRRSPTSWRPTSELVRRGARRALGHVDDARLGLEMRTVVRRTQRAAPSGRSPSSPRPRPSPTTRSWCCASTSAHG